MTVRNTKYLAQTGIGLRVALLFHEHSTSHTHKMNSQLSP